MYNIRTYKVCTTAKFIMQSKITCNEYFSYTNIYDNVIILVAIFYIAYFIIFYWTHLIFSHQYEGPHVHSCWPKRCKFAGPSALITTLAVDTKIDMIIIEHNKIYIQIL